VAVDACTTQFLMNKLVSVCIPTFNGEKYLRECLDSAISQSYSNIEIVIVDDKSTDETLLIIQEYLKKDLRIKLFINEQNLGLVGNWNRCVGHAKGEWIKYLFQDDCLHLTCIERMAEVIRDDCKLIVCDREFIFANDVSEEARNKYIVKANTLRKILKINQPEFINAGKMTKVTFNFINTNFIGEPTAVMFRKSLFDEIGDFNLFLSQICDMEYWLRISTNFGLLYIPETLASFRVHSQSMTAINRNTQMDLIDKVVISFELLNSDVYNNFRQHLTKGKLKKIREILKFRIYELELFLKKNPENVKLLRQYDKLQETIPEISQYGKPSIITKLIYMFVKLRRKIRN